MSYIIAGTARDESGNAVSDARVWIARGPVPVTDVAALTESDGRFLISVPSPGKYDVQCTADGYPLSGPTLDVGGEPRAEVALVLTKSI